MDHLVPNVLSKLGSYKTDPRKVEPLFGQLEDALHYLAAGVDMGEDPMQGKMFQSYSVAIDAFRGIMYYLRSSGIDVEGRLHGLPEMSKHPFAADEVVQHNPKVFLRNLGEVHLLRQAYEQARRAPSAAK